MATLGITARKSVDDIIKSGEADSHNLSKTLGPFSITAMGIGAIIGAGIFVLTGTASARYAGPAIMLSFVLGGIVCSFVGLCYAELASMLPVCGSSYTYTYATLGEVFAWIIGWDLILEYSMGAATVAVGWSGYFTSLLHGVGIDIPPNLAAATGTVVHYADGSTGTALLNLPAVLVVGLLTVLLIFGTKESARLNNIMVAVKLTVVVAFILLGAQYVNPAHWHPFIPDNAGEFGHFGLSGILRGSSVVFFAFIGFDAVSTAAQEAKTPQRDMPIGILGSLIISTLLYIMVAAVLTGLVPYGDLNVADPIAKGVDVIGLSWFSFLIKLGALTGLTTVILVSLFGQSRILYMMAHDGLLAQPVLLRPPEAADALPQPGFDRRGGRDHCRPRADRGAGRAGQHRHPVRLRPGLQRGDLPAPQRPRHEAPLPRSRRALDTGARHPVLPAADGRPAAGDVAQAGDLAGDRHGDLHVVRPEPFDTAQPRQSPARPLEQH